MRLEATRDYERWLAEHPDARPWIRTSTWQVPINWFVLFDDEEREYGKGSAGEVPVLRYRTPMVQARRRVARGLRALRDAVDESLLIDGLVDVGRWLEEFHPRSLVELDYAGLVHALPAGALEDDHSAADVGEGSRRCGGVTKVARRRRTGASSSAGARSVTCARRTDV